MTSQRTDEAWADRNPRSSNAKWREVVPVFARPMPKILGVPTLVGRRKEGGIGDEPRESCDDAHFRAMQLRIFGIFIGAFQSGSRSLSSLMRIDQTPLVRYSFGGGWDRYARSWLFTPPCFIRSVTDRFQRSLWHCGRRRHCNVPRTPGMRRRFLLRRNKPRSDLNDALAQ